ncbi:hypothetical protein SPRG_07407 [Saprolegnia parasitica CBS 223.65]|uniref:FACT complex subunit SSRP1 n=1 Tax=Saprolegnia parasitica (strain CBS 223.65) TaxID=695850 RepID=A0A067CAM1_SAPPC|nr:hypothetical protein SPRG_07407 [Saprolegnia parasitica CBS 223.65]KDO27809.1 hypothetical protein SPRG_07407 [Saprolegnia parasitica CBS 223.65]|eukprot:XP_012201583.1 hypothetical protein SPRG_07407 [Saprolegnia parasitica CBS 223.65]
MADESMRSIADLRDGAALCFAIAEAVAVEDDDVATWQNTIKFLEGSLAIAKQHHAEFVKTAAMSGSAGDNLIFTLPKTTCIVPKGKLDIDFGDYNVTITGKDFVVTTPYTNVDALLKLPRHSTVSKTKVASYEFVLRLETPVSYRKSTLKYIAFDVSATSAVIPNENILLHDAELENDASVTQAKLHVAVQMQLQRLMSHIRVIAEPMTGDRRYVSTHGESFVKCYRKTTSGHLFFLREGYSSSRRHRVVMPVYY